MVMRITSYLNKERTIVKEITEWFENRKDKMFKRVRVMLGGENRFMEFYHPGGAGEIKQWTQYPGKRIEVDFHVSGRLDRMVRRVETVGEKVAEHFIGRTDNLVYRSVLFTSDSSVVGSRQFLLAGDGLTPQLYIVKMTQRFAVDESLTSSEQHSLAKRVFYVSEGKAVATYHFKNDMITRLVRTYMYGKGVGVPSMTKHAYLQELGVVEDPVLLQEVALLERESYSAVRLVYQQMLSINTMRAESEKNVINEKNVFEIALNNADTLDTSQGVISEGGAERDPKGLNYLTPYLRKFKNKDLSELTREEAIEVRQNCLDALRSRLVERANIIQCRLNDENSKLGREQDLYQRRERDDDQPNEEYQKYCADAVFRIQILEQRLAAHEEAALKKFAELDVRLAADERLRVLWPTTAKT
jgi:hypothetical protein